MEARPVPVVVSVRLVGAPVATLLLHEVEDAGVGAKEGREVTSLHNKCPDHLKYDYVRRTGTDLQRTAFADELAPAALG